MIVTEFSSCQSGNKSTLNATVVAYITQSPVIFFLGMQIIDRELSALHELM